MTTPDQTISITQRGREILGHISKHDTTGEFIFVSHECVGCQNRMGDEIGTGVIRDELRPVYMCESCIRKVHIAHIISSGIQHLLDEDDQLRDAMDAMNSIDEFNSNSGAPYSTLHDSCAEMIDGEFDSVCYDVYEWITSIVHAFPRMV